ncbi:MAG: multicopper oxidase family protein [Rhodospirillaceae bacterium]
MFGAGAAALAGAAGISWWRRPARPAPLVDRRFPNCLRLPAARGLHGLYDAPDRFTLVSRPIQHAVYPNRLVEMLGYEIEDHGERYVNPVIRVRRGAQLRIRYWNALDEPSIVHWHGLKVDTNNDGHPHYAVEGGQTYDYQFTVDNRASTYWYHPHPHHLAARQAYRGLSGLFIVDDAEDRAVSQALGVHFGVTDVPLMMQDKRFAQDGSLQYAPGPHAVHGHLGDTILVNLTSRPYLDVSTGWYRFRLLNASNARIYRVAFLHDATPLAFHVIGGDGGLLGHPEAVRELYLAPAERADVVLDLRHASPGDRVMMASLPVDLLNAASSHAYEDVVPRTCEPLELLLLRVVWRQRSAGTLPTALSRPPSSPAFDALPVRAFTLDFRNRSWRINGSTYRMRETVFTVRRRSAEIWEFRSAGAAMPHPIHLHGYQFRILERLNASAQARAASGRTDGIAAAERGWKDTALLWPGETLRIGVDFSHPFSGDQVYMLQCHNLEHESHGMMVNFRVAA